LVRLGVFLVLAISWGSLAQASQIGINYGIGPTDGYDVMWDPLTGELMRVYGSGGLSGTLVGTPSAPGPFSQQITVQGTIQISAGNNSWASGHFFKGSDLLTVDCPVLSLNSYCWVDNTEPFLFTDASFSITSVSTSQVLVSQGFPLGGIYGAGYYYETVFPRARLQDEVQIPMVWQCDPFSLEDVGREYWDGNGFVNLPLNFIVSLNGNVATPPVPIPSAVLLLGSGLLRLAIYKRRKKS